MSGSSQKLHRLGNTFIAAIALATFIATFGTTSALAGAIFTTDVGCHKINGNIYAAKTDVYLNGGPDGMGSALEPNTTYCILVSAPGGTRALNTIECRKTTDSSGHFPCFNLFQCTGFDDTDNPGGEYKVEACPLELLPGNPDDLTQAPTYGCVFRPDSQCKSDNFKVRESVTCANPPCISCPLDIEVPCTQLNGNCAVVTYAAPVVIDDGAGATCDPPSGSCFPVGTTTVTCTVNGTETSCTFKVKVGICPSCTLTCPGPITVCNAPGSCTTNVDWLAPSCLDLSIVCTNQDGTVVKPKDPVPIGVTTITCRASDPAAGSCPFTITVNDCEAPTFTCPTGGELGCNPKTADLPTCDSVKALVKNVSDCDSALTTNCVAGDIVPNGCSRSQTFTVSVSDSSNNKSTECPVTFTWTVDTDPPAITCPPAAFVQSETFVPVTSDTTITLTAFRALGGTISDICASPTLTYKDSGPVGDCPKVYTRTYTAVDGCHNTNKCSQTITSYCPSVVTDTVRCTLPAVCGTGPGFRVVFTPDTSNPSCYKLNACNPGQFYDNVFYTGAANVAVTFVVKIPYPFVTQGANPIEVYGKPTVSTGGGKTCYSPGPKLMAGTNQITLANYSPQSFGSFQTLTVSVPAALNNGNLWLAVHLDYGLKGTTGYGKDSINGNAIPCGAGTRTIPNNQSYSFDGAPTVTSCNKFKNVTGVFGDVVNTVTQYTMSGVPAVLKDSTGKTLATATTDEDGFYVLSYKSSKDTTVSATITPSGYKAQTKTITLKANGIVEVDYTCP